MFCHVCLSLARYNVCHFRISCSGYFHVGAKTSTHHYISYISHVSLQLKGWNMESTAVRKKIPDLQNSQFSGSTFSMSGLQAMK